MKKQKLQSPKIDTPNLKPSLFEPSLYVKVKDTNHFVQLAKLAVEEKESFVDRNLEKFEEIFRLAVKEALARGLEHSMFEHSMLEQRSKIDTPKSIAAPLSEKEGKMTVGEGFEKDLAAFKEMEQQLKNDPEYMGKYVVIYRGELVSSGQDRDRLISDAYEKYGYVPLLVQKVGEKKVVKMRSPRFARHD